MMDANSAQSLGINWTSECAVCRATGQGIMFDIFQYFSLAKRIGRLAQTKFQRGQLRSPYLCKSCMERLEIIEKFEDMRQEFVVGFLGNCNPPNPAERIHQDTTKFDRKDPDESDDDCAIIPYDNDNRKLVVDQQRTQKASPQVDHKWSGGESASARRTDDLVGRPALSSDPDGSGSRVYAATSRVVRPVHLEPRMELAQQDAKTKVDVRLASYRNIRPKTDITNVSLLDHEPTGPPPAIAAPAVSLPELCRILASVDGSAVSPLAQTTPLSTEPTDNSTNPPTSPQAIPTQQPSRPLRDYTRHAATLSSPPPLRPITPKVIRVSTQRNTPDAKRPKTDCSDAVGSNQQQQLVDNYLLDGDEDFSSGPSPTSRSSTATTNDTVQPIKVEPNEAQPRPVKKEPVPEGTGDVDPDDDGLWQVKIEDCRTEQQPLVDLTLDEEDGHSSLPMMEDRHRYSRHRVAPNMLENVVESFLNMDSPKPERPVTPKVEQPITLAPDVRPTAPPEERLDPVKTMALKFLLQQKAPLQSRVAPMLRQLRPKVPPPALRVVANGELASQAVCPIHHPNNQQQQQVAPSNIKYVVNNVTGNTTYQLNTPGAPSLMTSYPAMSILCDLPQHQQQQQQQHHQIVNGTPQVVMVGGIPTLAYLTSSSAAVGPQPPPAVIQGVVPGSGGICLQSYGASAGPSAAAIVRHQQQQQIAPKMQIFPIKREMR